MLWDSNNSNNQITCIAIQYTVSISPQKKLVKPLKNCFLGPQFAQKGSNYGPHPQWKTIFWQKSDHQLSERFILSKYPTLCFD